MYDPKTGKLRWRIASATKIKIGVEAGCVQKEPHTAYIVVRYKGRYYKVHRVIWLMIKGKWPENEIDHFDHNGLNNRIENLKDVAHSANMRNQNIRKNSKTGVKGVSVNKVSNKLVAKISVKGRTIYLGQFALEDMEGAIAARNNAEIKHGFLKH